MNQKNLAIIKELKERLANQFDFISRVILFGSQVSGKASKFSDYDILIVVTRNIDWQKQREIVDEIFYLDLKYSILTDVKIISESELKTLRGKQPFIQSALKEGIAA